jgi:hypothetical protein
MWKGTVRRCRINIADTIHTTIVFPIGGIDRSPSIGPRLVSNSLQLPLAGAQSWATLRQEANRRIQTS